MPTIRIVDITARDRLRGRGPDERHAYREAIANLSGNRVLELTLDEGESLRKLKLNVTQAARDVGLEITYGETPEGTLLVWPATDKRRPRRVRAE